MLWGQCTDGPPFLTHFVRLGCEAQVNRRLYRSRFSHLGWSQITPKLPAPPRAGLRPCSLGTEARK